MGQRDILFNRFIAGLLVVLLLFGLGMTGVILWGNHALALRMLGIFSAMFTGVLGLGSGYLLGSRNGNGGR